MMIKAVIFDIDGTLLDTVSFIESSFRHTFAKHGLGELSAEQLDSVSGRGLLDCYKALVELDSYENLLETHRDFQLDNIELCTTFPEVRQMLNEIELKYKVAAATNRSRSTLFKSLQYTNLHGLFEVVVTPEDVDQPKPHPEMLLIAIDKLNTLPIETVMVGDTENDIMAGKRAGMKTILVDREGNLSETPSHPVGLGADVCVNDLSCLASIISKIS